MGFGAFGQADCACSDPCEDIFVCYNTDTKQVSQDGSWVAWNADACCNQVNCLTPGQTGILEYRCRYISHSTNDPANGQTTWTLEFELRCQGSPSQVYTFPQKEVVLSNTCGEEDCVAVVMGLVPGLDCGLLVYAGNTSGCTCDQCLCDVCAGDNLTKAVGFVYDAGQAIGATQRAGSSRIGSNKWRICTTKGSDGGFQIGGDELHATIAYSPATLSTGQQATTTVTILWFDSPSYGNPTPCSGGGPNASFKSTTRIDLKFGCGQFGSSINSAIGDRQYFAPMNSIPAIGTTLTLNEVGDTVSFTVEGILSTPPACDQTGTACGGSSDAFRCSDHPCFGEAFCGGGQPSTAHAYWATLYGALHMITTPSPFIAGVGSTFTFGAIWYCCTPCETCP